MGRNLPPGCTQADIDKAMDGGGPYCWGCKEEYPMSELVEEWIHGRLRLLCDNCMSHPDLERDEEPPSWDGKPYG